jgi:hypothetical protein
MKRGFGLVEEVLESSKLRISYGWLDKWWPSPFDFWANNMIPGRPISLKESIIKRIHQGTEVI